VIQGYENAGYTNVGTDASGINGDFQLQINIRKFELNTVGSPKGEVAFMAKILDSAGTVIDAKLFEASMPVSDITKPDVIATAINKAFVKTATDLIVWSLGVMSDEEGGGMGGGAQNGSGAPPMQTPEPPAGAKQPPAAKAPAGAQ